MEHTIDHLNFSTEILQTFASLDDTDILSALKTWQNHSDVVLSRLCQMILNRDLLKIKVKNQRFSAARIYKYTQRFISEEKLTQREASYFVFSGKIENQAYNQHLQNINILKKNGKLVDVAKASDHLNLKALSKTVTKYYMCYPKSIAQGRNTRELI